MADRAELDKIVAEMTKRLADQGKLIEAGWVGCRLYVLPHDAPQVQLAECKLAFMAGAQHLFHSIMILEPSQEPTDADVSMMDLIDKELTTFASELQLRVDKTKGSA